MIYLEEVDCHSYVHKQNLYELLEERTPDQSISHKSMPTYEEHDAFVNSKPYKAWYMVRNDGAIVGTVYISKANELGISIFEMFRGKGYAREALIAIMKAHEGPFLANINPKNAASVALFKNLGFKILQHTYSLGACND